MVEGLSVVTCELAVAVVGRSVSGRWVAGERSVIGRWEINK